jgi:membrane protease YdiL (CAAX protease family)
MIFILRATQRFYTQLAYAFLALAIPPMLWYAANYLGYGPATPDMGWFLWVGVVTLMLGIGLTAALLYSEKGKPSEINAGIGNLKEGIRFGGTALAASVVLVAAYIIFRVGVDTPQLIPVIGCLFVFSVTCAVGEELLFRGLLLSRLTPMVEQKIAFVVQAIAFAAYEATFIYMLNPDPLYSAALFVVAGVAGYLLAWMTAKNKSLLAPMMAHAGLYMIIALPIFTQFFA